MALSSWSVCLFFSVLLWDEGKHRVQTVFLTMMLWLYFIFELDDIAFIILFCISSLSGTHAWCGSLSQTTDLTLMLLMIRRGSKIASEVFKLFQERTTAELLCSLEGDSGDSKQQLSTMKRSLCLVWGYSWQEDWENSSLREAKIKL